MKLKEIEKFYKVKRKTKPHKPASPLKDLKEELKLNTEKIKKLK